MTWYGPMEESMLKSYGANPIPVNPPEAASSIRAGVVDAVAVPALWVVGSQMYTIFKYVNPLNFRYSCVGLVVSLDSWLRVPETYRTAVEAKCLEMEQPYRDEIRKGNAKAYNAMIKYGIIESDLSPQEIKRMKDLAKPIWKEFVDNGTIPKKLLDGITLVLANFRADKQ